ncbi:hypothetical protein E2562_035880, partial [Oryza meyeriana var. granulata]
MATDLSASRRLRLVPCIHPPDLRMRCPSSPVRWSRHPGAPVSAAAAADTIIEPLCSDDTTRSAPLEAPSLCHAQIWRGESEEESSRW